MDTQRNEQGYALIYVLLFITITITLSLPLMNSVLQDTRLSQTHKEKTQESYTLESAVELTKAIVKANEIVNKEQLRDIAQYIANNSETLIGTKISLINPEEIVKSNNVTYQTRGDDGTSSRLSFTFKSYTKDVLKQNKLVTTLPDNQLANQLNISHEEIFPIRPSVFQYALDKSFYDFAIWFSNLPNPIKKTDLEVDLNGRDIHNALKEIGQSGILGNNLYINKRIDISNARGYFNVRNLWVNDSMHISNSPALTIETQGDVYVNCLSLIGMNRFTVNGDLVIVGDCDNNRLENIDTIQVSGSLIAKSINFNNINYVRIGQLAVMDPASSQVNESHVVITTNTSE